MESALSARRDGKPASIVLMGFGLRYLYKLLRRGPDAPQPLPPGTTPSRPMAVAVEAE